MRRPARRWTRPAAAGRTGSLLLAALAAGAVGGCLAPCPDTIVPLETIVAEHNVNARLVPRLWARARIAVTLAAEGMEFTWGSASRAAAPNGLLLLAKSDEAVGRQDFVLIGRETAAVEVFRAGSSAGQGLDYFWYRLGDRGGWYARTDGDARTEAGSLPIDPAQLVGLLNVTALPPPRDGLPATALSMWNEPGNCAYVVAVLDRAGPDGRIQFRRELLFRWADAPPRRPYQVNLFDHRGRRVLTAHLRDYRPIRAEDLDETVAAPPQMPTDIEIVANAWPGVPTFVRRVRIVLSEMTTADKWDRSACDFAPPAGVRPAGPEPIPHPAAARRGGPDR